MTEERGLATRNEYYLAPAADVTVILQAYQTKKDIIEKVLHKELDYGSIPGSTKPALLKPGAEKLANMFGLAPVFEDIVTVEDWTGKDHNGEPFFYYRQKCKLYKGERLMGSADGSCNSWEKKYRYRQAERVCPQCGKPAIIKGKAEYGGGWLCFKRKDGCGAKFNDNDPAIIGQEVGQVPNPDVAEQVNTILKMAQKRALVAATLIVTGASDYFTQDVDDFIDASYYEAAPEPPAQRKPAQPPAAPTNGSAKTEPAVVLEVEQGEPAGVGEVVEIPAAPKRKGNAGPTAYWSKVNDIIKAGKMDKAQTAATQKQAQEIAGKYNNADWPAALLELEQTFSN